MLGYKLRVADEDIRIAMPDLPSQNGTTESTEVTRDDPVASVHEGTTSYDRRQDVRTWLQLVKAVLPLEREANKLFAQKFGQSLPRFDVLAHLSRAEADGLPVGLLAERLIASSGNITRLISRMVNEGLVERIEDAEDRRSLRILITDKGRTLYAQMASAHNQWASEKMQTLNDNEKVHIQQLMRRIRSS